MRIVFGIGIGFDGNGNPILPVDADRWIQTATQVTAQEWGGCFVVRGLGAWEHGGKIIRENGITLTVETDDDSPSRVHRHAEWLRQLFNQTSVVVSVSPSTVSYVSAEEFSNA
jgi:hypothetical protein